MMMKLLYWLTYGTLYLLSLLPLRVHYIISDFIYLVVYHLVGYRVKLVRKNLADSFPEKSETELRRIERDFYRWFCDYLVETVKLLTISEKELKRRMVFKGTEIVDEVVESGQSCAAYLGHYCNWEWITSLPLWVSPKAQCGQIYHVLENSEFDRLFLNIRQRMGAVCIPMAETLRSACGHRLYLRSGALLEQYPSLARLPEPRYACADRYGATCSECRPRCVLHRCDAPTQRLLRGRIQADSP